MSKSPYFYIDGKPRLLFILLGVRNDSILKHIQPVFAEHFKNIYYYKVWEHEFPHTTNYYDSWFTDVMIKKGSNDVVVVLHDENMDLMAETFDRRMSTFHSAFNHVIVKTEFRKPYTVTESPPTFVEPKMPLYFWDLFANEMTHHYYDMQTGVLSTVRDFKFIEDDLDEARKNYFT